MRIHYRGYVIVNIIDIEESWYEVTYRDTGKTFKFDSLEDAQLDIDKHLA